MLNLDNPAIKKGTLTMFWAEVEAMQSLDHQNIVKLHFFNESALHFDEYHNKFSVAYMAQEAILGGELEQYVEATGAFDEPTCRYFFNQLLLGLHHIHAKGFAHRDLKPSNILLDDKFNLKISDFGLAAPLAGDGDGLYRLSVGSPAYMAPEIIQFQPW